MVQLEGLPDTAETLGEVQASLRELYVKPPSTSFDAEFRGWLREKLRFKGRREGGRCSIFLTDQQELYVYGDDILECLKELKVVRDCLRRYEGLRFTLVTLEYERGSRGVAEVLSIIGPIVAFLASIALIDPLLKVTALLLYIVSVIVILLLKPLRVKILIRCLTS